MVSADEAGAAGDRGGVAWSRCLWRAEVGEVGLEYVVGLAGDVALQAADDLALGLAFFGASGGVGETGLVGSDSWFGGREIKRTVRRSESRTLRVGCR
ncbi:MAG: hypothetical protein QOD83_5059 [Solirubrobacteraceae bacterium]|nr:hypothetical protein [Solirubrobacteraceae bacterium]